MSSDWYDEMERAEQEYDAKEYEMAQEYKRGYEEGRADVIKTIDEELKEVRHCLELAKEQMLIDYVYIACEHLDNIEKLKEQK